MEDHTISSIYDLLDSLAAGQRQIMEEQPRIHNRLDALMAMVNGTDLILEGVATRLKHIEPSLTRVEQSVEIIEKTQLHPEHPIYAILNKSPDSGAVQKRQWLWTPAVRRLKQLVRH